MFRQLQALDVCLVCWTAPDFKSVGRGFETRPDHRSYISTYELGFRWAPFRSHRKSHQSVANVTGESLGVRVHHVDDDLGATVHIGDRLRPVAEVG